jgi:hypothetical protein
MGMIVHNRKKTLKTVAFCGINIGSSKKFSLYDIMYLTSNTGMSVRISQCSCVYNVCKINEIT